jgi:hypothetical protein
MKRLIGLSLAALLGMAATSWGAGLLCLNCGIHCMVPPEPCHENCDCPCNHGLHLCPQWKSDHAQKLIDELCKCDDCCARIRAVKKLGCPLHADWCCNHEVLAVLIRELQCDKCWEVRREAAKGIWHQNARTEEGVLALYIASKTDPHYLVRVAAAESLDIMTLNHKTCFTQTLKGADVLIVQLKKLGYKPGSESCSLQFANACACAGCFQGCASSAAPAPEIIPGPKDAPKGKSAEVIPAPATAPVAITTPATLSPMPMPGAPLTTGTR